MNMRTAKKEDAPTPVAVPPLEKQTETRSVGNALTPPPGEDIDGGDVDEVIKLDEGESVEVVYKGFKETRAAKPGETNRLHKLVMADGIARGMWGTVQLNSMLDKCAPGDHLWIAYLGKEEIPGGKTMHGWKVVRTKKAAR